jgi:site-specific DNA-methyltransferase (adenine-specific)
MRAKFNFKQGITNVWRESAVRGQERIKCKLGCAHMNQKPLSLLRLCVTASSDPGDVLWEPFGGLCSASLAAIMSGRVAYAAEINKEYFRIAVRRIEAYYAKPVIFGFADIERSSI